jgi:5,6-dimethylbenzimidazole synthase
VDEPARRARILENFQSCNARALASLEGPDAKTYATLRLAGLSDAPCHLAAFAEPNPEQGRVLGRMTMPETAIYSAVMAVHTLWLMARTVGLGVGWVSILDPAGVCSVLDVPPHWVFLGYLCIGYPMVESDTPGARASGMGAPPRGSHPVATLRLRRSASVSSRKQNCHRRLRFGLVG